MKFYIKVVIRGTGKNRSFKKNRQHQMNSFKFSYFVLCQTMDIIDNFQEIHTATANIFKKLSKLIKIAQK